MNADAGTRWNGMRVIARGANRVCVLDPDLPEHCLKYEQRPEPGMRRYWRRRLRHALSHRLPRLGHNATELAAWHRLRARLGETLDEHVTPCVGIVESPAGPALRVHLVTDAAGEPAPSLAMLLDGSAAPCDPVALVKALDRFQAWLLAHRIPLSDLNAGNLVVVRRGDRQRLMCVDLKSTLSSREVVPLSRWSWTLMRRKITRRCERLRRRLENVAGVGPLADPPGLP